MDREGWGLLRRGHPLWGEVPGGKEASKTIDRVMDQNTKFTIVYLKEV